MAELSARQKEILERVKARRQGAQAPTQSGFSGALDALTQGAAMGFGDELTAIEAALFGKTPEGDWFNYEGTMGDRYQAALDAERGQQDAFAEARPEIAIPAEIAGALATGAGAGRAGLTLMGKGGSVGSNIGRAAVEGAGYGGLYGAGSSDDDRLEGAMRGAGAGAITGGALAAGGATLGKIMNNRAAAKAAEPSRSLMNRGGAKLEAARQANPAFEGFDDYVMQAYRTLGDEGLDPTLHPRMARWMEKLEELSTGGTAPTYRQLDTLRKQLGPALGDMNNADQRRLATMARNALDQFMAKGKPAVPANIFADDVGRAADDAMSDVREGRELYRRGKNMRRIEDAAYKAEMDTATAGSGGNIDNNIRREVKRILLNPKTRNFLNADEIAELEKVVKGGPVENAMRLIGKLSPQGNGLMMALTAVGPAAATGATGNPLFMAPAGLGMIAKSLADATTKSKVAAVAPILASGGKVSPLSTPVQLSPQMRAIIDAMSAQAGGAVATSP
jgi:hypothetical protein